MDDKWKKQIKNYNKLSDNVKTILKLPYYQTSFLIDELINLEHEIVNGKIRVKLMIMGKYVLTVQKNLVEIMKKKMKHLIHIIQKQMLAI